MTLKELWLKGGEKVYQTDKQTAHNYLDVYDELFAPYKDKEIGVFEVGYSFGGSIKLWEDYFTKANIYCIDIAYVGLPFHNERVKVYMKDINNLTADFFDAPIDIAIDDGSHFVKDQIAFIRLMWPIVRKGGLLIIEDVHNLEDNLKYFLELKIDFDIADLRANGRHDNVLLIFRK